jgi:CelD/BcsL family acetyltransferase involved in cellulose biosynthesis
VPIVERASGWDSLGGVWNPLVECSRSAAPFLTWEWLSRWWEVLGGGRELVLLAARPRAGEAIEALAPLMLTREGGVRSIRFVGTGLSDCLDFIVPAGGSEGVRAFFDFLTRREAPRWDLIWLGDLIASDDGTIRSIEDAASSAGLKCRRITTTRAPYLDLAGDWNGFLAGKSRHFRRILKQKEDRVSRGPGKFEVERVRTGLGEQTLEAFASIDCGSWKGAERAAAPGGRRETEFLFNILRDFSVRGWLDLRLGRVDGKPAAYQINFDFGGKVWIYNNAFNRDFAPLSLGAILMKRTVEDAFNEGRRECDFLRGEEAYKSEWTDKSREVVQLVIHRGSLRSRLAAVWSVRLWRNATLLSSLARRRFARMKERG